MELKDFPPMSFPHSSHPGVYPPAPSSGAGPNNSDHEAATATARWRPGMVTIMIVVIALAGLVSGLYPMTAQWVSAYNQSKIITNFNEHLGKLNPSATEQLRLAEQYNEALTSGALLAANANVPKGAGELQGDAPDYWKLLRGSESGVMGRIKIEKIGADLPIYHGTGEDALLRGAGHLEGSHLPIGGESRHSVITAHRGLANAAMFTRLDEVQKGDTFTLEVLGAVLTYQVRDTKVVSPDDTDTIRPEPGKDLVTLVTCTPLGINTHRILVTAERITPTPQKDLDAARKAPEVPGFPWWGVWGVLGVGAITGYFVWSGRLDARVRAQKTFRQEPRHA